MYYDLIESLGENDLPIEPYVPVRPEKQDYFNKLMALIVTKSVTVLIPQDDDVDGFSCSYAVKDTINYLNPRVDVRVYVPDEKKHGVDTDFVEYVKSLNLPIKPIIFVMDSSSDCLDTLKELSKIAEVIHIDHHLSNNEEELNEICRFHANCRYEEDERLNNMSAGFYVQLFLHHFIKENTQYSDNVLDHLFSLGTLSLVADVCDTQLPYHKSIIQHFTRLRELHPLLDCFRDRFTSTNLYFLAFKVAPKFNMLFRLRLVEILRQIHQTPKTELNTIIQDVIGMYTNFRCAIENSLDYITIYDYDRLCTANVSYINDIYPIFKGKISNFTGWYANKISQQLGKPCIAVCLVDGTSIKGSVRDCTGGDVHSIMESINFVEGGGHPSAYGFTSDISHYDELLYLFYEKYKTNTSLALRTANISSLNEITLIAKCGEIHKFCEYNEFTLNKRLGFLYTVRPSDIIDYYEKRTVLKTTDIQITCFNTELKAGDTLEITPEYSQGGIKYLANVIQVS